MICPKQKIEPTNFCNLKCPLCPTNNVMTRARGYMKLELFKKIIDGFEAGEIKKINLWNYGEPFLNKELFEMIAYASQKNVRMITSTNSTILDRKTREKVLSCGLHKLIVCLDGLTETEHENYRVGSNFNEIVANIKLLAHEKKQFDSNTILCFQMLLTKKSEKNIGRIKDLAKSLGVDELAFKDLSLGGWSQNKQELAEKWLPKNRALSRYEKDNSSIKNRDTRCRWGSLNGTVLWNGDVTICCYDYNGVHSFVNIHDKKYRDFLLSSEMEKIRAKIASRGFETCKDCQESGFKLKVLEL